MSELEDKTKLPPEPEVTGVDPDKQSTPARKETLAIIGTVTSAGGLSEFPLSTALRDMIESGVRGQAGMVLLHASAERLERELNHVRQERDAARQSNEQYKEKYWQIREELSGLRTNRLASRRARYVQGALTTIGGVIAGISVPLLSGAEIGWPIAGIVLAVILLAIGWMIDGNGGEDPK